MPQNQNQNYRPQTRGVGLFDIQPVARPTDQFASPEVRRQNGGTELAQLAQSLGQLEPRLNDIFASRQEAEDKQLLASAPGVLEAQKITNQTQLMAAVNAGKIDHANNPWFIHALKSHVASSVANDTFAKVYDQYQRDGVNNIDNLSTVNDYFSQHLSPAMDGVDAPERAAMKDVWDQRMQQVLFTHSNRMLGQREDKMQEVVVGQVTAVGSRITKEDSLDLIHGTLAEVAAAQAKVTGAVEEMKRNLKDIYGVADPVKLDGWVTAGVLAAAETNDDANSASALLRILKSASDPSKALLDVGDAKLRVNRLEEHLAQQEASTASRRTFLQEQANKDAADQFDKLGIAKLSNLLSKGVDPRTAHEQAFTITPDDFSKLSPGAREIIMQRQAAERANWQASQEARTQEAALVGEAVTAIKGAKTAEERSRITLDYNSRLHVFSANGEHDLSAALGLVNEVDRTFSDDSEIERAFTSAAINPDSDLTLRNIIDRIGHGLSPQTAIRLADIHQRTRSLPISNTLTIQRASLQTRLNQRFIDEYGDDESSWSPDVQTKLRSIRSSLTDSFELHLQDVLADPTKTTQQVQKEISDFAVNATANLKLPTQAQMEEKNGLVKPPTTRPALPIVQPKLPDGKQILPGMAGQAVDWITTIDPALGSITQQDRELTKEVLNAPMRGDPKVDPYDVSPRWADIVPERGAVAALMDFRAREKYVSQGDGSQDGEDGYVQFFDPKSHKVQVVKSGQVSVTAHNIESRLATLAKERLTALSSTMATNRTVENYKATLDAVRERGGTPTLFQKVVITKAVNQIREVALLHQQVGYTPDEVLSMQKAGVKDAYLKVPMFINNRDIQVNGVAYSKALGLTVEEVRKFAYSQFQLNEERRTMTRSQYPKHFGG